MYFRPEFLSNDSKTTFIQKVISSLSTCDKFYFSVSFIKYSGLSLIEDAMINALKRGATGKLVTSTYQNFTDVLSLNKFLELKKMYPNFDVKLDHNSFDNRGFHSKGYIFEYSGYFEIIIGSSNLTKYALEKNIEWNLLVFSTKEDSLVEEILEEFNELFKTTKELTKELIHKYELIQEYILDKWDMDQYFSTDSKIVPNLMQKRALKEIERFRNNNVKRALVVAATGSGKTYLAGFDAKAFDAKRLLFVVHRDTILHNSLKVFHDIIGNDVTYGLLVGDKKEIDKDYIFASNIMLANHLDKFDRHHFDYIVIDEVHHSVAQSYQKIIKYFKPKFMLGLTATPERMDTQDVFALFEHNVPYELRLRDALLNNLIVPFKYYGIRDESVDYSTQNIKEFVKQLSSNTRVEFIDEKIKQIGFSSGKLKAIAFCKNIEHAYQMSEKMSDMGYVTTALIGQSGTKDRKQAFVDLQDEGHPLQMIFAVDILNEGVDIPAINMVLFLRPTESSTVFIQQLGRGLRKYPNKEYLTILDFIGNNYTRSTQIALALGTLSSNLYSDKKYLKDSIRNDFKNLDLPIEIHIDKLSKEEILKRIESTNFNSSVFLIQDYLNFKKMLGDKIPTHMDFISYDSSPDLLKYISKWKSYVDFLSFQESDSVVSDKEQLEFIRYLSGMLPIIRPYEYKIFEILLDRKQMDINELGEAVKLSSPNFNDESFHHSVLYLQNLLSSKKTQENKPKYIKIENNTVYLNIDINNPQFHYMVKDLISYGIRRYEVEFGYHDQPLKLYGKYDRRQFLLATDYSNIHDFPTGIWIQKNIVSIFVNLHKEDHIDETLKYEDEFITKSVLKWESSTSTTLTNTNGLKLLRCTKVHIFVRKFVKEDGVIQPYTYLGDGTFHNPRVSTNKAKTLLIDVHLTHPLTEELAFEFMR